MKGTAPIILFIISVFLFVSIFLPFISISFNFFGQNIVSVRGYELAQAGGYLALLWTIPICAVLSFIAAVSRSGILAFIASIVSAFPLLVLIYAGENPAAFSDVQVAALNSFVNTLSSAMSDHIHLSYGYYFSLSCVIISFFCSFLINETESKQVNVESVSFGVRECPCCAEEIKVKAVKCRFCGSTVEPVLFKSSPVLVKKVITKKEASNLLFQAVASGNLMKIKVLLDAGISPNLKDVGGNSLLDRAQQITSCKVREEVIALLCERGATR